MPATNKKFAIIGTGVVGTALAIFLEQAGWECVGVNTRSQASYSRFCKYLKRKHLELSELSMRAEIIFITTLDGAIEKTAETLTELKERKKEQIWIHCSGSVTSAVMCKDPLLDVSYLSIHPLQAFADVAGALTLMRGAHFGIEGSKPESEELGIEIVKILGGIPHRIEPSKKTLYHAGAVVASNYLVALASLSVKLFEQAGIHKNDALESLLPLMEGSYKNIAEVGLPCALTGPVARGDVGVVANHLQEMPPELRKIYRALGRLTLELGKERKLLNGTSYSPEVLGALELLLE